MFISKTFNHIRFVLAICFLSSVATAEIVVLENISDLYADFEKLDDKSLVLFDVDLTLVTPKDQALSPCGSLYSRNLLAQYQAQNDGDKSRGDYLYSQVLDQASFKLLDPESPSLISSLQNRGIPTLALTAAPIGQLGIIQDMADWRIDQLQKLDIDFSKQFPDLGYLKFPEIASKSFIPGYKAGVIFSSYHDKGDVLTYFLDSIDWIPNQVLFIDDEYGFIKSVEKALATRNISFKGYHYTASLNQSCSLNEKLVRFQFYYLLKTGIWLSDHNAEELLKLVPQIEN